MDRNVIFDFRADINSLDLPTKLNNPFETNISEIGKIAIREFQEFIFQESVNWNHDFETHKGKMFGILVVKDLNEHCFYLGTVSGQLLGRKSCDKFVPSVFDDSVGDFFINRGMTELSNLCAQIKCSEELTEIVRLKEVRKNKSLRLQRRLFENYVFTNLNGISKNVLEIFKDSGFGIPPAAAGECSAPKLLQFALQNRLEPIEVIEFWLGNSPKGEERKHLNIYPACKDKCRPILEFMLQDFKLFNQAKENYIR